MTKLLLFATAAADAADPNAIHLAALIVAYLVAFARLMDAARWSWAWLPTKLQPVAPAILAFATDLATGLGSSQSYLQIAQAVLIDLGPLFAALRGALPAKHFEKLDDESKRALREVREGKPVSRRPPPMPMLLLVLGIGLFSATTLPSCAAFSAAVPVIAQVSAVATQASVILDQVQEAGDNILDSVPNPGLRSKFDQAMANCRLALSAALAATQGAEHLTKAEADAALERFRAAWDALKPVLIELGLMSKQGTFKASPGQPVIPEPMALKPLRD